MPLVLEHDAIDDVADDARKKHDEGVDHALDQRERDHIPIGDVGDFVTEHTRDFLFGHAVEQARGNRDQRLVTERARGEGIWLALVNGDFRTTDAGPIGQLVHGLDEPGFARPARCLRINHARAGALFGHEFAHEQGDDRAGEAHHKRKHQQRLDVEALLREKPVHAKDAQRRAQDQHDGQVGQDV